MFAIIFHILSQCNCFFSFFLKLEVYIFYDINKWHRRYGIVMERSFQLFFLFTCIIRLLGTKFGAM
jgi:hypothetical protein